MSWITNTIIDMSKRIVVLSLLVLSVGVAFAQQKGGIYVKDYYPYIEDLNYPYNYDYTVELDIDGDEIPELRHRREYWYKFYQYYLYLTNIPSRTDVDIFAVAGGHYYFREYGFCPDSADRAKPYHHLIITWARGTQTALTGPDTPCIADGYLPVRMWKGDDVYYGWISAYFYVFKDTSFAHIYATAMCTVPNRPIFMGQRSLDESYPFDENTIGHAKPDVWVTNGDNYAFLRCDNHYTFQSLEVYDIGGRRLDNCYPLSKMNNSMVIVDLTSRNTGVYLARYRLSNGKTGAVKIPHFR